MDICGYDRQNYIWNNVKSTIPAKDVWDSYITLGMHDAMLLDYGSEGIKIKYVINGHLVEGVI
jgi:hypothetical protein